MNACLKDKVSFESYGLKFKLLPDMNRGLYDLHTLYTGCPWSIEVEYAAVSRVYILETSQ